MEKSTVIGTNRTGVDMSPMGIKAMVALVNATPASSPGHEQAIADMRVNTSPKPACSVQSRLRVR